MAYEKRVCVMKQVKKGFTADGGALSGAVYAERTGETLKITPRLLGLAPVRDGRYVLVVRASGQTFCLDGADPQRNQLASLQCPETSRRYASVELSGGGPRC